ncbi:MAG TPA: hypothetical protein VHA54_00275 [Solirubrobacterales bacterium]|nr:hypothetical protein [Solirubrobacterales bacterium]
MSEGQADKRPPRGALIVVAVGLLACIAAALLSTDRASGEAADLEWVQHAQIPDSEPADVPGGPGQMQLVKGRIEATGTNFSRYSLFLAGATLRIDGGSPVGRARILCTVDAKGDAEIARTTGLRATFPRSSEDGISGQDVPEAILIDFSARGGELIVLEPPQFKSFTTEPGVKLEWPKYEVGVEHLKYFLAGKPKHDLLLPFYTVWKATKTPAAALSCTLTTSAGKATVRTVGALKKVSPPIDEEAEERNEERAEEEEQKKEEKEAE